MQIICHEIFEQFVSKLAGIYSGMGFYGSGFGKKGVCEKKHLFRGDITQLIK
jgi:hypothetical protein